MAYSDLFGPANAAQLDALVLQKRFSQPVPRVLRATRVRKYALVIVLGEWQGRAKV
jgi:hypothetical protein